MVREDGGSRAEGNERCERRPRPILSGAVRLDLSRLARREARLVHQPAALVGSPDSCMDCEVYEPGYPDGTANGTLQAPCTRSKASSRDSRTKATARSGVSSRNTTACKSLPCTN